MNQLLREGHVPSSFSIVELILGIFHFAKIDSLSESGNIFLLSKGHASLALYATLEELGHISLEDKNVSEFRKSNYGGHPDRLKVPGVIASTGSLGHGLPLAIGIALADKCSERDRLVFVLIGDGELNEGSCWESLALIQHHDLRNVVPILDLNNSTNAGLNLFDVESKFKAFGFEVTRFDGHSLQQIQEVVSFINLQKRNALIADTVKGYGIQAMEISKEWHHKVPSSEQFEEFCEEVKTRFA